MEKTKTSKKALTGLINDATQEALKTLELPQASKKVRKLLQRNAKKLASIFAETIRRENKKQKKAARFMEDAVKGKSKKKHKKSVHVKLEKQSKLEAV